MHHRSSSLLCEELYELIRGSVKDVGSKLFIYLFIYLFIIKLFIRLMLSLQKQLQKGEDARFN